MSRQIGFSPIYDIDSTLLILGSFPSVKSREQSFYYGNPRNRFWQVLAEAFDARLPQRTEDKIRLCLDNGVALWDIVTACDIEGSMDADIRDYEVADLQLVLSRCPIERILCNGSTAYRITKSAYRGDIQVIGLPSTSPANFRFDKAAWLKYLRRN